MERTRSLPSSLRLIGLILCGLLLSVHSYSQEVIPEVETVTRDGLIYHQDTNKPVTGIVEEFHENGQLMGRGNFIDGKREGLFEYFDEDGNLTDTRTYRVSR